ncbi:MAG: hypothetical protein AAB402_02510 [Patescibacteria group bacterium]
MDEKHNRTSRFVRTIPPWRDKVLRPLAPSAFARSYGGQAS